MALSPAFLRALLDAEHYHHEQIRKDTTIPYMSHLMGVSSLVLEGGGTEIEAIAALLHDAVEDAGGEPILRAIQANYGDEVATIVEACSDASPARGEEKPPWVTRKKVYFGHLITVGASTMLVSAADKLHNLRSIYSDYCEIGIEIFERFNTPTPKRDHVLWYYGSLRDIYERPESAFDSRRARLFSGLTELLERLGYVPGKFEP